jgi:hypothetical protein
MVDCTSMKSDVRFGLPTRRHLVFGATFLLVVSSACSSDDSGSASSEAPSADSTDPGPNGTDAGLDLEGIERGVLTFRMAAVGDPGNPSVGVTTMFGESGDFVDTANGATYESCDDAPSDAPTNCITSGAVDYEYEIGELEVTVGQYVTFLNTVDPEGSNRRKLFLDYMSPVVWPKYGSIDYTADAPVGEHYAVAAPEWTDKPFGFADFLRSARFVNALFNGDVVSTEESSEDGFDFVTYEVRLSRETEKGMYDLTKRDTPRTADSGFVVPSYDEWVWRRMHGGVANAPVYQLAIGAIGFQPQDQAILDSVYPWFGLRIGFVPAS